MIGLPRSSVSEMPPSAKISAARAKNAAHFLAKIQLFQKIFKKIGCSKRSSFSANFLSL